MNDEPKNSVTNFEILKMLFNEHHRQLAAKRKKIHNISERTLAVLLLIAGWLIVKKNDSANMNLTTAIAVSSSAVLIAISAFYTIYNNNKAT